MNESQRCLCSHRPVNTAPVTIHAGTLVHRDSLTPLTNHCSSVRSLGSAPQLDEPARLFQQDTLADTDRVFGISSIEHTGHEGHGRTVQASTTFHSKINAIR